MKLKDWLTTDAAMECRDCIHEFVDDNRFAKEGEYDMSHLCYNDVRIENVTGNAPIILGIRECQEKNEHGNCTDFQQIEE